jgi:hypothetical protein
VVRIVLFYLSVVRHVLQHGSLTETEKPLQVRVLWYVLCINTGSTLVQVCTVRVQRQQIIVDAIVRHRSYPCRSDKHVYRMNQSCHITLSDIEETCGKNSFFCT